MSEPKAQFAPTIGDCYSHGWKVLMKLFGPLILVGLVYFALSMIVNIFSFLMTDYDSFGIFIYIFIVVLYGFLILGPAQYGLFYAYLKAVRGENIDVQDIFAFKENYLNVVLANVLTAFIIGIGTMMLIIPGIIFACKLAFVPYLVIDKKMDAMEAMQTSWKMTEGHSVNIFVMGLLGVLISIGGLIAFLIGVIVAAMWIILAYASMYHAVDSMQENELPSQIE